MQTRSVGVVCSFNSCRQGAFGAVLQFQLVQARSFGLSPFRLVQTRSVGVAFYARADQELWCCLLCSCRPGALVRAVLGSCEQGAFVGSSSDLRESFLAIFIAMSLDRVIEEVFG
ncbi:hypothetical protein ACFX2A_000218 [Malus domestica]